MMIKKMTQHNKHVQGYKMSLQDILISILQLYLSL